MMGFFDNAKKIFGFDKKENEKNINDKTPKAKYSILKKVNNFTYLDELIHSGEKNIVLDSNIILGEGEESKYPEGIYITANDLVIDGNGYTIDGLGKTLIFQCNAKNLIIKNITLKNGHSRLCGAIYNFGELTLIDSALTENTAKNGGAVYNFGNMTITDCILSQNSSESVGGAIYNYGGVLNIIKSTFTENASDEHAGAIINFGSMTVKESLFQNNKSRKWGGAIVTGKDGITTIDNSTFSQNMASNDGGAIYNDNEGNTTINDSTFTENSSERSGAIYNGTGNLNIADSHFSRNNSKFNGGAIHNYQGDLNIVNSTFNENLSKDGGAISNQGNRSRHAKLMIKESTFTQNKAQIKFDGFGGAIYNYVGEVGIVKSIFIQNIGESGGGAICSKKESKVSITQSTINENESHGKFGGGAICNIKNSEMQITDSTLDANISFETGGAIHNGEGDLTIEKSIIKNNISKGIYSGKSDGGAIEHDIGNLKIFDCEISSNKSKSNIILSKDKVQIHNTIFNLNQSKDILFIDGKCNLGMLNCKFIENNFEEAIIFNNGNSCSLENPIFENNIISTAKTDFENSSENTTDKMGSYDIINKTDLVLKYPKISDEEKAILNYGYIFIKNAPQDFETRIENNGTVENDESIIPDEEKFDFGYLDKKIHESSAKEIILDEDICFEKYEMEFYEGGIDLDIDNLVIEGNGHTISGVKKSRIFLISGKNITLRNIIFKRGHSFEDYDNQINSNGGAVKVTFNGDVIIENCEFIHNISEGAGGVIENSGKLAIVNSSFKNNISSLEGGAISSYGELLISESIFYNNKSKEGRGGAISSYDELKISKSSFTNNKSIKKKGGVISSYGALLINESEFNRNMADRGGGALLIEKKSKATVTKSTFNCNKIEWNGGAAIYNYGKLTIRKSLFEKNDGGAIINNGEGLNISESIFTQNTSTYGGAIENIFDKLNISQSKFCHNSASLGGAIYNKNGYLYINDSMLIGNVSHENSGGAIRNYEESSFKIENCELKNNNPDDIG